MNIKRFRITFFSALLAIVFGVLTYQNNSTLEKDVKAQYLKGGDFQLITDGGIFNLSDLKGQPVVLYFGYTHCPDICPVGLAVIRDALNSSSDFSQVKALFVTLDPERDNAERMKTYTAFFHSNIIGLTGAVEDIKKVAGHYGTYFRKTDKVVVTQNYSIEHTAYFYLIDKEGVLVRVLDHDTDSKTLAALLEKML